jgi:ATP-dependent protease ClpP protease subunit
VGQESAAPTPNQPIVVLFIGQITGESMQRLMSLVTVQVAKGADDITIALSSGGGDTGAAFGAYNAIKALENQNSRIKVKTVNIGSVASAAVILFCAGNERYSLPNANFLIHGNGMDVPPGTRLEAATLKNSLDFVTSMNDQTILIIASTTKKKKAEIEAAVGGQVVLSPTEAKNWNLIQDIRPTFAPSNATVLTVSIQQPEVSNPGVQVTSISQTR